MNIAFLAIIVTASPAAGPSLSGSVGAGAMYSPALPAMTLSISADLPVGEALSAQMSFRGAAPPMLVRPTPPFLGLWRVSTTAGLLYKFITAPIELKGGAALVAGIGTILVTDVAPPIPPDFGVALIGQGRWRFAESASLCFGLLLPVTIVVLGPGSLSTHPEVHVGVSWDFPSETPPSGAP